MSTPLPTPDETNLHPPDADEVRFITRGLISACRAADGINELQAVVIGAVTKAMTGIEVDMANLDPIGAAEYARGLARRNEMFRTRMVQLMELGHMVLPEASTAVADRVIEFANELSIDNDCIHKAREVADGSRALVAADFDRAEYLTDLDLSGFTPLETADDKVEAWSSTRIDADLAHRWRSLGDLGADTLGRGVHDFYLARGFRFPGEEGSAPPLLAQHDWVHVLADYGTKVESELEVFAFIARASDNPTAFTLLAMVLNLFQSGMLPGAAGIFEADPGQLAKHGMPERLADALRRGALCEGSLDFLSTDFFAIADHSIDDLRVRFGISEKSEEAVEAGSPGPWGPGGISGYQVDAGRRLAAEQHRTWDPFGADVGVTA